MTLDPSITWRKTSIMVDPTQISIGVPGDTGIPGITIGPGTGVCQVEHIMGDRKSLTN